MLPGPLKKLKKLLSVILAVIFLLLIVIYLKTAAFLNDSKLSRHIFRNNQEEYVDRHGIKVVVGHYIGNAVKVPNATNDMVNQNNYDPKPNAGKNGQPYMVQPKDLLKMQQYFQINRFNLVASDQIPLNRSLPDYRRKRCSSLFKNYKEYPKTSIIIVFHNEAWSTLLRTVWSVVNRSPKELLEEIILVDDASEREFLKQPLEDYILRLPVPTHLLRSKKRVGLIQARLQGAKIAKGRVLTFLDAHCECTKGWLEPLLSAIKNDRKAVVTPVIDIIHDSTFAYVKSFELHMGAFNWNLQFRWYTLGGRELTKRKKDPTQPFDSPTMAGGLFAIDKGYFYELGSYDEGMSIWGGENLEMSFRVWQCGGKIQIAPCSHVGHIFRKSSPYSFPGGIKKTVFANLARVALVWMDDWSNFYFKYNEAARSVRSEQNVTSRLALRQKLNCKSFAWYLKNVWPQHIFPAPDRFFGRIRNVGADGCLIKPETKGLSNQPTGSANIDLCIRQDVAIELFVMTPDGFIMTDDSICLDAPEKSDLNGPGGHKVRIIACSGQSRQRWSYDKKTQELRHVTNQKCLDTSDSSKMPDELFLANCDGSEMQKWKLEPVPWNKVT